MESAFGKHVNRPYMLLGLLLLTGHVSLGQHLQIDSMAVVNIYGLRKVYYSDSTAQLPAQENYLTFFCSASTVTQVQYRLLGLEEVWTNGYSTDQIHYANLVGGQYRFQLRPVAKTREQPSVEWVVNINIPFWKRIWFWPMILLYLMGMMGVIIYLFVRYRFLQKLRAIKVRDRIARDLHDDMGSYLSSISIMSQTAHRNVFRNPEKAQNALDTIGKTARQVIDRMGDMVWSINPSHDSITDVLSRMSDVGNSLFDDPSVVFNLSVADEIRQMSLSAEVRREFFLIYKEALTNVARYAAATGVRVTLRREGSALVMTVQDNGCGFDTANPAHRNPGGGNGLRNMEARAKLIGAELTINSVPGEGSTVRLLVVGSGNG